MPPGADKKYDIMPISVGTDPNLTLKTRRAYSVRQLSPGDRRLLHRGAFHLGG